MKLSKVLAIFFLIWHNNSQGQTPSENLSNLKYYLYEAQSNLISARYYLHDSLKMNMGMDSLDEMIKICINRVEALPIPIDSPVVTTIVEDTYSDTSEVDDEIDFNWNKGGFPDFNPLKKIKSHFLVEVGINNLLRSSHTGIIPELNPGKSWFWNFGFTREQKLSKVLDLNFGITYLMNSYSFGNDVIIGTDDTGNIPSFKKLTDIKEDPCLNTHYITVPISFDVNLSKTVKLNLGGVAGYRMYTNQKYTIREGTEDVDISRKDNFGLNNWMYGARGGLGVGAWDLFFEYRLSNIFRVVNVQNYKVFMIGTSWRI
jgi:hypothetical protein